MSTYRIFFEAMSSRCEIRLAAANEFDAKELAQIAIDEVWRIEAKYSRYRVDSIVSRLNTQAGKDWVECDDETLALLDYADMMFEMSDGLFDMTSGVLHRAWDFRKPVLPTAEILRNLCSLINWKIVQRDGRHVRLPQFGMELDFGGFGKEYAADRAVRFLLDNGVRHGYVNLAGDIRVLGPQPLGDPWLFGIQDPRCAGKLIASIPVFSGALTTSGDYERFFEFGGHRYCHILHPHSGHPVVYWRSVSVLAPTALVAGSFSTIAMLKQEEGRAFLDAAGVIYLAVGQNGELMQTSGCSKPMQ